MVQDHNDNIQEMYRRARAAFEITVPNIVEASVKGESDPLKGVTENVIVGQSIPIGTGLVDLYMSTLSRGKTD